MPKKIAFWIDSIEQLNPEKDSTLQIIQSAQKSGYLTYIFNTQHIQRIQNEIHLYTKHINVFLKEAHFYQTVQEDKFYPISDFSAVFIRKNPPFDSNYLHACQILVEQEKKIPIYNKPSALCLLNEKTITQYFPKITPEQIITSLETDIIEFSKKHEKIVIKPLDGMGGDNIFITGIFDPNLKIIINNLSKKQTQPIIAQVYLPEIKRGDKRILMINGKTIDYVLVRKPQGLFGRGNLVMQAKPEVRPIKNQEKQICNQLTSFLKQHGLFFVGVDMIGEKISEINITSPTGICEINTLANTQIADLVIEQLC